MIETNNDFAMSLQIELIEKEKEIERLKIIEEKYKDSQLYIHDFKEENERLHSIIKEVREYINMNKASLPMGRDEFTCEMRYSDPVVLAHKVLEILDKENK